MSIEDTATIIVGILFISKANHVSQQHYPKPHEIVQQTQKRSHYESLSISRFLGKNKIKGKINLSENLNDVIKNKLLMESTLLTACKLII